MHKRVKRITRSRSRSFGKGEGLMAKGERFSSVPISILILVYRGARKERRESGNYLSSFFVISALSVLSEVNKYIDISIHPFSILSP